MPSPVIVRLAGGFHSMGRRGERGGNAEEFLLQSFSALRTHVLALAKCRGRPCYTKRTTTSMFAATSISDEILELKKQRKAILLAHHYQEPEIQELADVIGDSLELARKARDFQGDVIAFCGVWFMAETAKVLNPARTVVVPDRE